MAYSGIKALCNYIYIFTLQYNYCLQLNRNIILKRYFGLVDLLATDIFISKAFMSLLEIQLRLFLQLVDLVHCSLIPIIVNVLKSPDTGLLYIVMFL